MPAPNRAVTRSVRFWPTTVVGGGIAKGGFRPAAQAFVDLLESYYRAGSRSPERESGDEAVPDFEIIKGHFGLLPGFAKDAGYGKNTYNARSETVDQFASFKHAWSKARHCIVPCEAIYEPDWRTGEQHPSPVHCANDAFGASALRAVRASFRGEPGST